LFHCFSPFLFPEIATDTGLFPKDFFSIFLFLFDIDCYGSDFLEIDGVKREKAYRASL